MTGGCQSSYVLRCHNKHKTGIIAFFSLPHEVLNLVFGDLLLGFTLENEVNSELENAVANAKPKSPAEWDAATDEVSSVASSRYTNGKVDKPFRAGEPIIDESVYARSEGSTWSPHGSPGRSALGSPSRDFHSTFSPRTKESSRYVCRSVSILALFL